MFKVYTKYNEDQFIKAKSYDYTQINTSERALHSQDKVVPMPYHDGIQEECRKTLWIFNLSTRLR